MDPEAIRARLLDQDKGVAQIAFAAAIAQIIVLDIVFSINSILTAVGMTDDVPIMVAAVVITVAHHAVRGRSAGPVHRAATPRIVMLALAFLVMIGLVLIADGFGFHVPKGYIYVAMGFSVARRGAQHESAATAARRRTTPQATDRPAMFRKLTDTLYASPQIGARRGRRGAGAWASR